VTVRQKRAEGALTGELEATVNTQTGGKDALAFTNKYNAVGDIAVAGGKVLVGRSFTNADVWAYALTCEDGAPVRTTAGGDTQPSVTTNNARGSYSFGKLYFQLSDLADKNDPTDPDKVTGYSDKTFTYRVAESWSVAHVTNDARATAGKTFQVKVAQHRDAKGLVDGTLDVALAQGSEVPTFTNRYVAQGHVDVRGTKTLVGRPLWNGDPWTFSVARAASDPTAPLHLLSPASPFAAITDGKAVIQKTASSWTYGFRLSYTLEDLKNADGSYDATRTFYYTVTDCLLSMCENFVWGNLPNNEDPERNGQAMSMAIDMFLSYIH
jgi:hypothetical protein